MNGDDGALELAAGFPEPSRDDWLASVENVLRGSSFDDVLVSSTRDDLDIQPLYTADDVTGPQRAPLMPDGDRIRHGWDVRQRHDAMDAAECNRAIIEDLENGVTSVELGRPSSGWSEDHLRGALAGVMLDIAPVALSPHADVGLARAFASIIAEQGDGSTTASWLGLDPLGEVGRGAPVLGLDTAMGEAAATAAALVGTLPRGRTVTVDTTRYSDAGATEAQELAWAIATGVAYLRAFEDAGVDVTTASSSLGFRLTVGPDQFATIAVLRAARRLWTRVLEACGVAPADRVMDIQAVTSRAMYSRRDPWVNMLRATTAALGAGVGGADAITVLPFDTAIGASDEFGRRTARNTQLLLVEESHLAKLVDPAGGAWFVESLTERLTQRAWSRFQGVEAAGGMSAVLADGSLVSEMDEAWEARLGRLVSRRDALTGVSEFPLLEEPMPAGPEQAPESGLPLRRLAAPFEELRDAADRATAATGSRPAVFLAALGELPVHTSRSTWITNLLAVGGVAAVGGDVDGSQSPLEAEARFSASGTSVAVICSSDAVYAERAAATVTALREAGARKVVLAGEPRDLRSELDRAGVDEYWHAGIDVLDALRRLHSDLGI